MVSAHARPAKVIQPPRRSDVKTFTFAEEVIEAVSRAIMESGVSYAKLAEDCDLNPKTVERLARRDTRWPKSTTLFSIMGRLGLGLRVVQL